MEHGMSRQSVNVVIVGGGQAGLAISHCLTEQGRPHVVLEQNRMAESWRSKRWDSLRLIGPNWTLRLPGYTYAGDAPDRFMGKDDVVGHLEAYARSFGAPVRERVRVRAVEHARTGTRFVVSTDNGPYEATRVVIATGALQRPFVPGAAAELPPGIAQFVPAPHRNPAAL